MIAFIEGEIARLTPTGVILMAGGVGYDISITLPDYTALRNEARCRLWITEIIREDAHHYMVSLVRRHSSFSSVCEVFPG